MTPKYLSEMWTAFAEGMGNHLWQSTVFAIVAGSLALVLRANHARFRYGLWFSASLKFLIPFSLLVGAGSHLALLRGSAGARAGLYVAIEEVIQPFTDRGATLISQTTRPVLSTHPISFLPVLLIAVWLCGFLTLLCVWSIRWRRIAAIVREGLPIREGREVKALIRLEPIVRTRRQIEILSSRTFLEPGIFGVIRPVLVWPQDMSERLEDPHLEAILTHELWHVRRRDNLAATIHMVVEAIFWFHPLVWWIGARLMEERERACDEAVLAAGTDRKTYAESILQICKFCVGTTLACVSGVTGSDLKRRISRIMTDRVVHALTFGKKFLLGAAAIAAIVAPISFGLLHAAPSTTVSLAQDLASVGPRYQSVSIIPNKAGTASLKTGNGIISQRLSIEPGVFIAMNVSTQELIRLAYEVQDYQISGSPDWFASELYDVKAKAEQSAIDSIQKLGTDQRKIENQRMLQMLLQDSFRLTLRQETKNLPVYALVLAEPVKLHEVRGECPSGPIPFGPGTPPPCGSLRVFPWIGSMDGLKVPMTQLVAKFSEFTRRTVLDNTDLVGKYDIDLKWFPDSSEFPPRPAYLPPTYQPDPNSPPLLTAIQQQLGLKLESQTGPVHLLVIDHAEKPPLKN